MATHESRLGALITALGTDYKVFKNWIGDLTGLTTSTKVSLVAAINEVNAKPSGTGGAVIADGDDGTSSTTTYSASKIKALNDAQNTAIGLKADDNAVVKLTTAQSISGIKTFVSAPVVPDSSFSIAKTNLLQAALDAKAAILDTSPTNATTTTYSASKINSAISALETKLVGGAGTAFDTFKELQDLMAADDTETAGIVTALGLRLRFDAAQTLTAPQKAQGKLNLDAYGSLELGNPDADLVALYITAKS